MDKGNTIKNSFIEGAISTNFIANSITKHQIKTDIGAHDIFLGQVRADQIKTKKVRAITYTTYKEMANLKFHEIKELAFKKYNLSCLHIYHSLGEVKAGEICLFVFVSAKRRKDVFKAIEFLVTHIKEDVPIFGKEIFEDQTHQWKINS